MNVIGMGLITEGKTKKVYRTDVAGFGIFESTDNITAGDGAKRDVIPGKGRLANEINTNIFNLLNACGIPTAFNRQFDNVSFVGNLCEMIEYEVIIRREAYGSYLKGFPYFSKNDTFPKLLIQFNLKTTGNNWKGIELPEDDPLIIFKETGASLYSKKIPFAGQEPFMILDDYPLKDNPELLKKIEEYATKTFLVLEKAWQQVGGGYRLIDLKVEFGINACGQLVLADVIDPDSGRVIDKDGNHLDKQLYRDGEDLDKVFNKYKIFAEKTRNFYIPDSHIVIWTGSKDDDISEFKKSVNEYLGEDLILLQFVCSMHKQPVIACYEIIHFAQMNPDSVVIAYIGMSNGAGPVLSTQVSIPVISVPVNFNEFKEDVYSSLRMPSFTPNLTVIKPSNAILAALEILAIKNPKIYMQLRWEQEKRLTNFLVLD